MGMGKFELNLNKEKLQKTLKKESPKISKKFEDKGFNSQYASINEFIDQAKIPRELGQLIKQQETIYIEKDKLEKKIDSIKDKKGQFYSDKLDKIFVELSILNENTEKISNKIRSFIDQNQNLRQKFEALIRELKGRRKVLNPEDLSLN